MRRDIFNSKQAPKKGGFCQFVLPQAHYCCYGCSIYGTFTTLIGYGIRDVTIQMYPPPPKKKPIKMKDKERSEKKLTMPRVNTTFADLVNLSLMKQQLFMLLLIVVR